MHFFAKGEVKETKRYLATLLTFYAVYLRRQQPKKEHHRFESQQVQLLHLVFQFEITIYGIETL